MTMRIQASRPGVRTLTRATKTRALVGRPIRSLPFLARSIHRCRPPRFIPALYASRFLSHHHYSSAQAFNTVNSDEIAKFSAKADEWWDPHGEFGMLHLMNPARIGYLRQQLAPTQDDDAFPFRGMRILDIGCGGGLLSESLTRLGADVVGADASYDNIQMARWHASQDPSLANGPGSLDYRHMTAEDLVKNGDTFDAVCALEILEHVSHPRDFLQLCTQLVSSTSPVGKLVLSTISRTSLSYFLTVFMAERVLRMVHQGTHDWSKYVTSDELAEGLTWFGWRVDDTRACMYDPLRGRWHVPTWRGAAPNGVRGLEVNYFLTASRA